MELQYQFILSSHKVLDITDTFSGIVLQEGVENSGDDTDIRGRSDVIETREMVFSCCIIKCHLITQHNLKISLKFRL